MGGRKERKGERNGGAGWREGRGMERERMERLAELTAMEMLGCGR